MSGYKFAIMEQTLEMEKVKFSFKMIKGLAWLALGICIPSIIKEKNYFFAHS